MDALAVGEGNGQLVLVCVGWLAHHSRSRESSRQAECRQSSDRNFDVLHDVLLASGGGTRVHPIRAPGAM